jgi:hypothetical protein
MSRAELAFALILCLCCPRSHAKDLSSMYDRAKVAQEQPRLKTRITEIYEKAYRPNLLPEEQRELAGVALDTPLVGDPVIGYHSNYKTRVVTLPAVSLLFFEDMCTAYAWLYVNGYRLETVEEYITMLKYKDIEAFGGRYPPPLKALGIPDHALEDPRVNGLSLHLRNSGWAFILAHELGHIRYQHGFSNELPAKVSQENEEQADQFALEMMRRATEIPMGGLLFFQSVIYYLPNRADFQNDQKWQEWLDKSSTHPLTAARLQSLSQKLNSMAPAFARGESNMATGMETVHFIGSRFAVFGEFLSTPLLQQVMAAKARKSDPSSLLPRRKRETIDDFQIH